jgi:hypothetical protein
MNFVTSVRPLSGYKLELTFKDGLCGVIDLEGELTGIMFEPLRDPKFFRQVQVDGERNTIVWPNGVDLAPEFLYEEALKSRQEHHSEEMSST